MKKRIISLLLAIMMIASVATVVNATTQIEAGTTVTLPANNLVVDGGFETAAYDNPSMPIKSNIPTFTATEDAGNSTQRSARNAQVINEEGVAIEGKQCIYLNQGENVTIALPNLYEYKGSKLIVNYYVKAKLGTQNYGTWGKLEDRAVIEDVLDAEGKPQIDEATGKTKTKFKEVYTFAQSISFWENPKGNDYINKWTLLSEEIVIPDTIGEKNEYVLNFGTWGNYLYFDAISCVLKTADGTEVNPSVFATPTPAPTVEPTPPIDEVTVKFKKSKVTVKKGKKKVLKVTLKNAKKATFSVNKKGKKVVKLSKKKAKSVTVTGKKKGKATITAKASGKKATCKVTVK